MTAFRLLHILSLHRCIILFSLILALIVSFAGISGAVAEQAPVIKQIEIKGNSKMSEASILSKMTSRVGIPFSKNSVQQDIREIYKVGYFDDIRVEIDSYEGGVKLIYTLIEKPTVISIDIQGNEEIDTDDIKEELTITSGAIANLSLIADNVQKIVAYYQSEGYWLAKVFPIIHKTSEDAVALTFNVEEGPEVTIRKVTIEGNNALTFGELKKVMKTRKWWIFSFLTGSGTYKENDMRDDLERIRILYNNNGYINVAVSEPKVELSPDNKDLYITLTVSEGEQYSIGKLEVEGNTVFSSEEIIEMVSTSSGEIFNRTALMMDIDKILDRYMEKGYARADINPMININQDNKLANIKLSINEAGIFSIGRINISGNTKTRDKVIRREIRLNEGDTYNKKLLTRSYQRIHNLDYFENVELNTTPRVEEQLIDLDVDVKEKMTGMMSIGGGYSTLDQFVFMAEVSQTNLFGRGLNLKFKVDLSSRRSNYRISLSDPWFMDKPISASFSLYKEVVRYLDYDKDSEGGSIGFGKELSEYTGGRIVYNIEDVLIKDVSSDASSLIRDQEGQKLTSSISPSIWKDTRDSRLEPTKGSRNALYTTIAGLGGDNYFVKGVLDSSKHFPVIKDHVISLRGRLGLASGFNGRELPLYERFYVGGINTVRGLGFGEGGPRKETTYLDSEGETRTRTEKIGGEKELIFNVEYIVPLIRDIKLKGLLFYDYGAAFDSDIALDEMRKTAGFGVRWISPLGPIRLEWGFNLDPRDDESSDKIEFSMGGFF